MRITVRGADALAAKLGAFPEKLQAALTRATWKASLLVQRRAMQHLTGGNPLHVWGKGPTSRHLRAQVTAKVDPVTGGKIVGHVGTAVVYGPVHEYGATITNGFGKGITIHIPKRPWLNPSLEEQRAKIDEIFNRAVTTEIQKAGL